MTVPSFNGATPFGVGMDENAVISTVRAYGAADWAAAPSSWLSDIPRDGGNVHVPGLTEMPIRWDEGPPWRSKAYHVPSWYRGSDRKRVALLRKYSAEYGHDPRLRQFVIKHVLAPAGVLFPSRQYAQQAAAILSWVQRNIAYVNEPGELIQGPWHTLKVRSGDCDDLATLVAAMAETIGLGWRFVLGGSDRKGRPMRWTEGTKQPSGCQFFHIYLDLGWPALRPKVWKAAEPTMPVPLGYDIAIHGVPRGVRMPEAGAASLMRNPMGPSGPMGSLLVTGPISGPEMGAIGALSLRETVKSALPSLPEATKYGKDVLKLAVVGVLAQVLLLLLMRSKLGKKIKKVGTRKNPRAKAGRATRRTRRNHCGCGGR
jgi:hypothetical protein